PRRRASTPESRGFCAVPSPLLLPYKEAWHFRNPLDRKNSTPYFQGSLPLCPSFPASGRVSVPTGSSRGPRRNVPVLLQRGQDFLGRSLPGLDHSLCGRGEGRDGNSPGQPHTCLLRLRERLGYSRSPPSCVAD